LPSSPVPLRDGLREEGLLARLESYPWFARTAREEQEQRDRQERGEGLEVVADASLIGGEARAVSRETVQDVPLDFGSRRFATREVVRYRILLSQEMIRRDELCISPASS
jgi:hypothetical protein